MAANGISVGPAPSGASSTRKNPQHMELISQLLWVMARSDLRPDELVEVFNQLKRKAGTLSVPYAAQRIGKPPLPPPPGSAFKGPRQVRGQARDRPQRIRHRKKSLIPFPAQFSALQTNVIHEVLRNARWTIDSLLLRLTEAGMPNVHPDKLRCYIDRLASVAGQDQGDGLPYVAWLGTDEFVVVREEPPRQRRPSIKSPDVPAPAFASLPPLCSMSAPEDPIAYAKMMGLKLNDDCDPRPKSARGQHSSVCVV